MIFILRVRRPSRFGGSQIVLNSVSGIYLFSSLPFSVYYSVLKSRMCNLTFEFILHLHSFFRCFLFFFIPIEGLCCRPKYRANITHRFDDQNSLTSKCIENWALFERLTHSQWSALSPFPRAPRGCAQRKALESQLSFCPVQGYVYKHLSAPGLALEKISVSRGEAQPFGEFTQLSARVTVYDNSVYGNLLRQKDVAKVSEILEGSDFNIKSIYKKVGKRKQKEGLKNKMRRKYLSFLSIQLHTVLKEEKERDSAFKAVWRDAKKRLFKGHHFLM